MLNNRDAAAGQETSVGCVMVALAQAARVPYVKRSIRDYCHQTWANKTLVIGLNGSDTSAQAEIRLHVIALDRPDITLLDLPDDWTLGRLRNVTQEHATGEILCQWDDDDLHHPRRIEEQLACLRAGGHEAVFLQEIMQYSPAARLLYCTNWRATQAAGLPGTLMVRRSCLPHYPTDGPTARLGEDSAVARDLLARGRVGYLSGSPHLYVYVNHGANSWHQEHHRMLVDSLSISRGLLLKRETQIREGMAPHGLKAETISVMGSNGVAFIL